MFFSSPSFNPDKDIPDLAGKVILVTGGNNGLGKESILQLSKHNPSHIYLAARSKEKALEAIQEIKQVSPSSAPITFLELDLSSFESIRNAVKEFSSKSDKLNILLNNAGIMAVPAAQTKEGYEVQFGTNHMGHALLTRLLLPTLQKTASSEKDKDVRVITLASAAEGWSPSTGYPFDGLKTDLAATSTLARYAISKQANIHYARKLATQYPDIKSISLHPGVVDTNISNGILPSIPLVSWTIRLLSRFAASSVATGARNQLWASVSPEAKSGLFYWPVGVAGKESKQAGDDRLAQELWDWTEKELDAYLSDSNTK